MLNTANNIIQFTGENRAYYGDSVVMPEAVLAESNYVKMSQLDIPLGQSRYGGPVVDLPPAVTYPDGLLFAAQLDLAQFSPHDVADLLPKTGQLIFFADAHAQTGNVLYADVPNEQLVRTVKEHEELFFAGVLIDRVFGATESLSARYRDPEFDDEREDANEAGKIWDDYAEGIFSVLINRGDLQNRAFTNCRFSWAQS